MLQKKKKNKMISLAKTIRNAFIGLTMFTTSCAPIASSINSEPEVDLESSLRAKYGCISKVEIPHSNNINLIRSVGKNRAEKAYLKECVKTPEDSNFLMIDVAYDFKNGIAFGFAVKK